LVQPQYSPMPVEQQIAILYCGTNGLLKNIPLDKVTEFEKRLLSFLELNHQADVLDILKQGTINDDVTKIIRETSEKAAQQFL
ncbi:ATP synthase subunit alpha, partial [termite gut metagenome]